jgi:hypothetical protein
MSVRNTNIDAEHPKSKREYCHYCFDQSVVLVVSFANGLKWYEYKCLHCGSKTKMCKTKREAERRWLHNIDIEQND